MAPLTKLNGVGKKKAELLEKLGLFDTEDLLRLYPRRCDPSAGHRSRVSHVLLLDDPSSGRQSLDGPDR